MVHKGKIIGRSHDCRIQSGSAILHGEMDTLVRGTSGCANQKGMHTRYYSLLVSHVQWRDHTFCPSIILCRYLFPIDTFPKLYKKSNAHGLG